MTGIILGCALIFTIHGYLLVGADGVAPCYEGPAPVVINEDAVLFLGVILNVRGTSDNSGTGTCGSPRKDAVEFYEALRWFLSILNQNSGQVYSRIVTDSYISGTKLGLKIYDNCGSLQTAEGQLASLFPDAVPSCQQQVKDQKIVGLIDCVGVTDAFKMQESLRGSSVPYVRVNLAGFFPNEELSEALLEFLKVLEWEHATVLYDSEYNHVELAKVLNQHSRLSKLCLEFVDISSADRVSTLSSSSETAYVLVSDTRDRSDGILKRISSSKPDAQYLLVNGLACNNGTILHDIANSSTTFTLTGAPYDVDSFETYWNRRRTPVLQANAENVWLLEYFADAKRCKVEGVAGQNEETLLPCLSFTQAETPLDRIIRHSRIIPAVHSLNTYATTLRKAWEFYCTTKAANCTFGNLFDREEFYSEIFTRLEVRHDGPGSRVPPGLSGYRLPSNGELVDPKFNLLHLQSENFTQLYTYQSGAGLQASNVAWDYRPNKCGKSFRCKCIGLDASVKAIVPESFDYTPRLEWVSKSKGAVTESGKVVEEEAENSPDPSAVTLQTDFEVTSPETENDSSETLEEQVDDIIIPALFPVHKAGPTPLQCGTEVNAHAIKDIEAFLWALDQVNKNLALLGGIEIGAIIFDTCSSPLKAAHLVSSILTKEGDTMLQEIDLDPEKLLTFVSATSTAETEAAAKVLGPAQITTVSTRDRGDSRRSTPYLLQVDVPFRVAAEAVTDLVNVYGWNFVSVVYSSHDEDFVTGFNHFEKLADSADICFATVEMVNKTTATKEHYRNIGKELADQTKLGANVVILWTNEEDTAQLLNVITEEDDEVGLRLRGMVWIHAAGGLVPAQSKRAASLNWISVRQSVSPIPDFESYYTELVPETNLRNPWFNEYWDQMFNCTNNVCEEKDSKMDTSSSTTAAVQAVYIVASALARLFQDHCASGMGSGNCTANIFELRKHLHRYLRYTGTDRPDESEGEFSFTEDSFGNTALDIVRLKKNTEAYERIAVYHEGLVDVTLFSSDVLSECELVKKGACQKCFAKKQNQLLVKPSSNKLYIAGLFDVMQKNEDSRWYCGMNVTDTGIQQTEAFLWAIDYVNRFTDLLPGVNLGAIGLDGCGSHEKQNSDLGKLLRRSEDLSFPDMEDSQIVGVVIGTPDVDQRTVLEIRNRFQFPVTFSGPTVRASAQNQLMQLGPSVPMIATALADMVTTFNWTYISLVCSSRTTPLTAMCDEFQSAITNTGVKLATNVLLNYSDQSLGYWEDVASKIYNSSIHGASVLVSLASKEETNELLKAARKLESLTTGIKTLTLLSWEGEEVVKKYLNIISGALVVKPDWKSPVKFVSPFSTSRYSRHSNNPWLSRYWTQQFDCRGLACEQFSLQTKNLTIDDSTAATIEGVMAIASALGKVRKEMCPFQEGLCDSVPKGEVLLKKVQEILEKYPFTNIDGKEITFNPQGTKSDTAIAIVGMTQNYPEFFAGRYSASRQLRLNTTTTMFKELASVKSICLSCVKNSTKPWEPSTFMQVSPRTKPGFSLMGFLPVHRQGQKQLKCGEFYSARVFQNLAAVSFALEQLQRNSTLPAALHLGGIFFDTCERSERAQQKLFSFISDNITDISFSNVLGALTFEEETALGLSKVLEEEHIPHFNIPLADGSRLDDRSSILQTIPSFEDQAFAMFEIVSILGWKYAVIFYDDSPFGMHERDIFLDEVQTTDICIGAQIRVPEPTAGYSNLLTLLEKIKDELPPLAVAVMLLRDMNQIERITTEIRTAGLSARFLVVSNSAWDIQVSSPATGLVDAYKGVLTVSMETHPIPLFRDYFLQLDLQNHSTLPDDWFEEFYQHYFQCHLNGSKVVQNMYSERCSGFQKFPRHEYQQDPFVYHTLAAVDVCIRALTEFLQMYCSQGLRTTDIKDCGPNARQNYSKLVLDIHNRTSYFRHFSKGVGGLFIWSYSNATDSLYEKVGMWRDSGIELNERKLPFLEDIECTEGPCMSVCSTQSLVYTTKSTVLQKLPEIPANFSTAWGVVTIAFSVLGLVLASGCAAYFYKNLPKATATYILNYTILVGLGLLYVTSVFFLLQPTATSCGLRRFFLGAAYATVFSGLLVRSVHSWRRITRGETNTGSTACSASSTRSFEISENLRTSGLLFSTLCLIGVQVILLSAWLIFKPPSAVLLTTGLWRCAPAETFEDELIVSLIYPMIVLAAATVFSFFVSKSSDAPKDGKAMLACCSLVAFTWFVWTLVATQSEYPYRDPAIVAGIIVCAKVILVILYGRKVYDIAVHRQESQNLAVLSQYSSKLQTTLPSFDSTSTVGNMFAPNCNGLGLSPGDLPRHNIASSMQDSCSYIDHDFSSAGPLVADVFDSHLVPCGSYAADRMSLRSGCTEGDRELSESEEYHQVTRPRFYVDNTSLADFPGAPIVRRIGSRHMLVLGDEASIHGRVSKI